MIYSIAALLGYITGVGIRVLVNISLKAKVGAGSSPIAVLLVTFLALGP